MARWGLVARPAQGRRGPAPGGSVSSPSWTGGSGGGTPRQDAVTRQGAGRPGARDAGRRHFPLDLDVAHPEVAERLLEQALLVARQVALGLLLEQAEQVDVLPR